ncbi:hypothetical protein V6N11_063157 [Hibiscus sabdariffa]|uniref:Uncharacterized protein n=2 Tax=Hibiscus sabdariffa TaxID=183260 RepID=A0ABR2A1G9_9ROSI
MRGKKRWVGREDGCLKIGGIGARFEWKWWRWRGRIGTAGRRATENAMVAEGMPKVRDEGDTWQSEGDICMGSMSRGSTWEFPGIRDGPTLTVLLVFWTYECIFVTVHTWDLHEWEFVADTWLEHTVLMNETLRFGSAQEFSRGGFKLRILYVNTQRFGVTNAGDWEGFKHNVSKVYM